MSTNLIIALTLIRSLKESKSMYVVIPGYCIRDMDEICRGNNNMLCLYNFLLRNDAQKYSDLRKIHRVDRLLSSAHAGMLFRKTPVCRLTLLLLQALQLFDSVLILSTLKVYF